jgi:hypothetical protein
VIHKEGAMLAKKKFVAGLVRGKIEQLKLWAKFKNHGFP